MDAPDQYISTLQFVLSFLNQEGFHGAEQALLSELAHIHGTSSEEQPLENPADLAAQAAIQLETDQLVPQGAGATNALQVVQGLPSRPNVSQAVPMPGPADLHATQAVMVPALAHKPSLRSKHLAVKTFSKQQVPWDEELDEYENHDDVGYLRKDISGQQQFVETELDDAEDTGERYFTHAPGAAAGLAEETDSESDDDDGSSSSSSMQDASAAADSALLVNAQSTPDEAWDLGPMDIKFAEPVSTPSKSPSKAALQEESRPVLSRVESLSSSFKDFDVERATGADEEQFGGRVSGVQSEDISDADVIDFRPLDSICPEDLESFRLGPAVHPSKSSSIDALDGSLPPSTISSVRMSDPGKRSSVVDAQQPRSASTSSKPVQLPSSSSHEDGKEAASGGFSFPVTPPPMQPAEADPRLFKSWPSVRSSCTSEFIAASDDDHIAADYADDEYSKGSRAFPSSQSLSEMQQRKTTPSSTAGSTPASSTSPVAAEPAADQPSASEDAPQDRGDGWDFARSPTLDNSQKEPSLDLDEAWNEQRRAAAAAAAAATTASAASTEQVATSSTTDSAAAEADQLADQLQQQLQLKKHPSRVPRHQESLGGASVNSEASVSAAPSSPAPPHQCQEQLPDDDKALVAHNIDIQASPSHDTDQASEHDADEETGAEHGAHGSLFSSRDGSSGRSSQGRDSSSHLATCALPDGHEADDEGGVGEHEVDVQGDSNDGEEEEEEEEGEEDEETDFDGDGPEEDEEAAAPGLEWQQVPVHHNSVHIPQDAEQLMPRYTVDENGMVMYEYDREYLDRKYEVFDLRVIHRRHRTGFEEAKDFPIRMNDLIAGRYQVMDFLGSAAFSRAVQALDVKTGMLVCLKIIKNNKDYFDQSLDEIKLLKFVNTLDPDDRHGLVRLYDYFYYKEHLFLVCELLRANLYEFQKYNRESGDAPYFTNARIQRIARQVLSSLGFLHSLGLIHSDLKPENILIKSYSKCEVKVIDLGSSCFITDQLSSYVQSRSYRAPEVILGLPYDQKVDIWSLGCILAELSSGYVLFQNDSLATLLARLTGILGPIPEWMLRKGRYSNRFFTRSGHLYERSTATERYELLIPKQTSLKHRSPDADEGLLDFIAYLLNIDPHKRPSALEALQHPWLQMEYPSLDA